MNNIDEDIKNIHGFIRSIKSDIEDEAEDNFKLANSISNVLSELKKQTNIAKKEYNEHMEKKRQLETQINNTHILQSQLDVANAEKTEWKKIAELLAERAGDYGIIPKCEKCSYEDSHECIECIIDWARKEVENDKS